MGSRNVVHDDMQFFRLELSDRHIFARLQGFSLKYSIVSSNVIRMLSRSG